MYHVDVKRHGFCFSGSTILGAEEVQRFSAFSIWLSMAGKQRCPGCQCHHLPLPQGNQATSFCQKPSLKSLMHHAPPPSPPVFTCFHVLMGKAVYFYTFCTCEHTLRSFAQGGRPPRVTFPIGAKADF